jgi:hypothetical protein
MLVLVVRALVFLSWCILMYEVHVQQQLLMKFDILCPLLIVVLVLVSYIL